MDNLPIGSLAAHRSAEACTVGGTRLPPMSESKRRVVFVVGSGRSGTSTMAGALQTLGMHVPQPEVRRRRDQPQGLRRAAVGRRPPHRAAPALQRARSPTPGRRRGSRPARLSDIEHAARPGCTTWLEDAVRGGRVTLEAGHRRARRQGPAAGVVPRPVAVGGAPLRRARRRTSRCCGRVTEVVGSKQRYYAQTGRFGEVAPHRRLGQHDAAHRARHPRGRSGPSSATTTC